MNESTILKMHYTGVFCLVLFTSLSFAQDTKLSKLRKPDFSGIWVPNSAQRKPITSSSVAAGVVLEITHRDPELVVKRLVGTQEQYQIEERIFFTDGRGETYHSREKSPSGPPIEVLTKTKAKWDGKKIRIESRIRRGVRVGMIYYRRIEEWSLSEDANTLTRKIITIDENELKISPGGVYGAGLPKETKELFRRVEKPPPQS